MCGVCEFCQQYVIFVIFSYAVYHIISYLIAYDIISYNIISFIYISLSSFYMQYHITYIICYIISYIIIHKAHYTSHHIYHITLSYCYYIPRCIITILQMLKSIFADSRSFEYIANVNWKCIWAFIFILEQCVHQFIMDKFCIFDFRTLLHCITWGKGSSCL